MSNIHRQSEGVVRNGNGAHQAWLEMALGGGRHAIDLSKRLLESLEGEDPRAHVFFEVILLPEVRRLLFRRGVIASEIRGGTLLNFGDIFRGEHIETQCNMISRLLREAEADPPHKDEMVSLAVCMVEMMTIPESTAISSTHRLVKRLAHAPFVQTEEIIAGIRLLLQMVRGPK